MMSTAFWASQVALVIKNPPASEGNIRDTGSILGSGGSPGGGYGNLQSGEPMDRGLHSISCKESDTTEAT